MQNWSCGYYLLYFAPFLPLFAMHRMWTSGKLKDLRLWASLAAAAIVTLALTIPFLLPYSAAQKAFGIERPFGEIVLFSANVWSYITASENLKLFGKMLRFYPHGEGETFLGFTPWLLAAVAGATLVRSAFRKDASVLSVPLWRTYVAAFLLLIVILQLIGLLSVVLFGGFDFKVLGVMISARTPQRLLMQFVIALALLLGISARARIAGARIVRSPIFFALAATILAVWLSLGPLPNAGDQRLSGFGLYDVLYRYVPGFNGVRVPARYAMIAGSFLAVLAGFGMRSLLAQVPRPKPQALIVAVLAVLILIEGAAIPMEINRTWNQNEAVPPARVMKYLGGAPGLRAGCRAAGRHRHYGISIRRRGVGDPLRLLLRRALEADHQRLQRRLPAELQDARRATPAHRRRSGSGMAVAQRLRLDARGGASKRVCKFERR